MTTEEINKIIDALLSGKWDFSDEKAEKLLGGEYTELYKKQKGVIVTACKELFPIRRKIDDMTWNNQHSELMLEIARFCNDDKYIKIFEDICDLHNIDGSLHPSLGEYRESQWNYLKTKYKEKLQPLRLSPTDAEEDLPF